MRLAVAVVVALAGSAHADDDLAATKIVFARGNALVESDARGKSETEIATLPAKSVVRALRVDALGKILLADIGGTWSWLPLDGSTKALAELPCDAGPAQLAEDGACVLCRQKGATKAGSIIVNLKTGNLTPVDLPIAGARLAGAGTDRKLVWADKGAVWTAAPAAPKSAKQGAKQAPLRALAPSPDGTHALGIYKADVFAGAKTKEKKETDVLMVFALDGEGARRKVIQNAIPIEWSHDSKWILVQDRASACVMAATGGQYKCWKGYTAAAIAPNGKYALLLGNRDKGKKPDKKSKSDKKKKKKKAPEPAPPPEPESSEPDDSEHGDEPVDDVPVEPPSGPQALYRAQLEGAYTSSPQLVTKVIDGAAVWIPSAP